MVLVWEKNVEKIETDLTFTFSVLRKSLHFHDPEVANSVRNLMALCTHETFFYKFCNMVFNGLILFHHSIIIIYLTILQLNKVSSASESHLYILSHKLFVFSLIAHWNSLSGMFKRAAAEEKPMLQREDRPLSLCPALLALSSTSTGCSLCDLGQCWNVSCFNIRHVGASGAVWENEWLWSAHLPSVLADNGSNYLHSYSEHSSTDEK